MDTLQARIVQLEQENAALRALLKKHGIAYPETSCQGRSNQIHKKSTKKSARNL